MRREADLPTVSVAEVGRYAHVGDVREVERGQRVGRRRVAPLHGRADLGGCPVLLREVSSKQCAVSQ